jgi:hypothetical protein
LVSPTKERTDIEGTESWVLGRIFGSKREEVVGGWRRLHNEELLGSLYVPENITRLMKSRRMRWAGHLARMGEIRNAYNILVGKPEGKRTLGRCRRRLEDNIRVVLREIVWEVEDWIYLVQDRFQWRTVVYTVMNFLTL